MWEAELRFANHLADVADRIALAHFRGDPATRRKADGTIVTEADEAVEDALRRELRHAYPDHAILGEEQGGDEAGPDGVGLRWIIDPIDGTNNYSWGIPVWATLIALETHDDIVVGVVSAPALGERYEAARGSGARRNGHPMHVSDVDDIADARVAYGTFASFEGLGHGEAFLRLVRRARSSRGFGDFWGHMLVASGCVEMMVEPIVNVWDLAALLPIVEEAGGRLTDLDGRRRVDGGSCLTSNGVLHEEVLAIFRSNVWEA